MAQPWVTGPVHFFFQGQNLNVPVILSTPQQNTFSTVQASPGSSATAGATGVGAGVASITQTPIYFGTCEGSPDLTFDEGFEPVMNDLSGSRFSLDDLYEGEEAIITGTFTRWNENVLAAIQARANLAVRGSYGAGEIGSLMVLEGLAYQLYMLHPFAAKPAMAGMPAGYRFQAAYLLGPDRFSSLGTRPKKISLVWKAKKVLQIQGNLWSWLLYDHNVGPVSNLPIN